MRIVFARDVNAKHIRISDPYVIPLQISELLTKLLRMSLEIRVSGWTCWRYQYRDEVKNLNDGSYFVGDTSIGNCHL